MKKGFSLAFLVMSLIILFHVDVSIAIPWKANATVEEYLIPNEWEEPEFSLGSHVGRMLYDVSQSVTGKTAKNGQPATPNCAKVHGYRSCLPSQNGGPPKPQCGDYQRVC